MCHNYGSSTREPVLTTREATAVRSLHTHNGEQPLLAAAGESPGAAAKTQPGQNHAKDS